MKARRSLVLWLSIIATVVVVYAVVGFFVVPRVAEQQIEERGTQRLGRPVQVERVEFNPFTFQASVHAVQVQEPDGSALVAARVVRANFDPLNSLWRQAWSLGHVAIIQPQVRVVRQQDGGFNLADLMEQPKDDQPPPSLVVERLVVEEGRVEVVDQSQQETWSRVLAPVSATVTDFATTKDASGTYELRFQDEDGATFTADGTLAAEPWAVDGRLEVVGVPVSDYLALAPGAWARHAGSGTLALSVAYQITTAEELKVTLQDGRLGLSQLSIVASDDLQPVLELPQLDVHLSSAAYPENDVQVAQVEIRAPWLRLVRTARGFNLAELWQNVRPNERSAGPSTGAPITVSVQEVALREGTVVFEDTTLTEPMHVTAQQLDITLAGLSTDLTQPVEVALDLVIAGTEDAHLSFSGQVRPSPIEGELQGKGQALPLSLIDPYTREYASIEIAQGLLAWEGTLRVLPHEGSPRQVRLDGAVAVTDLSTRDAVLGRELAAWRQLLIEGVDVTLQPGSIVVEQVRLTEPAVHLLRSSDGTFNVAALGGAGSDAEEPASAADATVSPSIPWSARVGTFVIEDGRVVVRDESMDTPFQSEISGIRGGIENWSTRPDSTADVALAASFDGRAPIAIEGTLNPRRGNLLSRLDVTLDTTNVPLDVFEPYIERFLGYEVAQGEMRADFTYELAGGELDGMNRVLLDHFYLGEQVESPHAVNAPIKLGLAALRDRNDEIRLELPVQGSLAQPDFSFGSVIRGALGNVFRRVATAPFSFLGNLLGIDGGQEMANVTFAAGQATLEPAAREQLDRVGAILKERPALTLVVNWTIDPQWDAEGLREERLRQLEQRYREQLAQEDESATAEDALRELYAERFPDDVPSAPPPEVAAAGPDQGTWLGRLFRSIFGGQPASEVEEPPEEAEAGPSVPEMRSRLLATIEIEEAAFAALAQRRAQAVQDQLLAAGVPADQVHVAEQPGAPAATARVPENAGQVYLALQAGGATEDVAALASE